MNFQTQFTEYRRQVEEALEGYTASAPSLAQGEVLDAMRYSLLGGGKRLRAVLALEFCRIFGGDPMRAMPAACALEMVHAYSLIHDDLPCMDDDDLRRGKPSCHKRFGESLAVLAGDGLLTLAFETLSCPETIRTMGADRALGCIGTLARNAGEYGMLGGQVIDVQNEGRSLTPEVHAEMVRMKTGALVCAATQCGCIAAGAGEIHTALALSYAQKIGEAFQITDDLLDVIGDAALLGKSIGTDARDHKNTYVTLLGQERAAAQAAELFAQTAELILQITDDGSFLRGLT
ncbi:MAG: polyprenyl synthetase family protein, partial [Oscillospiraceae bacterium]